MGRRCFAEPRGNDRSRHWAAAQFEGSRTGKDIIRSFPFNYDGKPSSELLKTWDLKRASRKLDDKRTEYTLAYTDPKTGLVVRCVGIEYLDYPVRRMDLVLQEHGRQGHARSCPTSRRSIFRSSGKPAPATKKGEFLLHHNTGSPTQPSDYQPHQTVLGPGRN